MSALSPTEEIIGEIAAGRMVILVDEEDRENEGDLVLAADCVPPAAINFMARHGRGLICLTLTDARCRQLGLEMMVRDNRSPHGTAFTVSIEAAEGVSTGISAHDRARTIQAAVARNARPDDLIQPGHIFPLRAQPGGVLVRAGHTEAGCDLAQLAGREPSAVICEILSEDGTMARLPELTEFAHRHGLKIGAIRDLIHFRARNETLVEQVAERVIATAFGEFRLVAYADRTAGETHLALVRGTIRSDDVVPVRVHEATDLLDFLELGSVRHSFGVPEVMRYFAARGSGVLVILRRPENQDVLVSGIRGGSDADVRRLGRKWDPRTFGIGAQILHQLGVRRMRLLGQPQRIPNVAGFDLEICGHLTREGLAKETAT